MIVYWSAHACCDTQSRCLGGCVSDVDCRVESAGGARGKSNSAEIHETSETSEWSHGHRVSCLTTWHDTSRSGTNCYREIGSARSRRRCDEGPVDVIAGRVAVVVSLIPGC